MKKRMIAVAMTVSLVLASLCSAAANEMFELMGAIGGQTTSIATTNSSALLSTVYDAANGGTAVNWNKVRAVLITAETNDARVSIGVAAENDETPVGHVLASGSSVRFSGNDICKAIYIISKTSGSASALQVTVEY